MAIAQTRLWTRVVVLAFGFATSLAFAAQPSPSRSLSTNSAAPLALERYLGDELIQDASAMIAMETCRDESPRSEERIQAGLDQLEAMLGARMDAFPGIARISWRDSIGHRIFAFRFSMERKKVEAQQREAKAKREASARIVTAEGESALSLTLTLPPTRQSRNPSHQTSCLPDRLGGDINVMVISSGRDYYRSGPPHCATGPQAIETDALQVVTMGMCAASAVFEVM